MADANKLGNRRRNVRRIQDTLKVSAMFVIGSQEGEETGNRAGILYRMIKEDNFQKLMITH